MAQRLRAFVWSLLTQLLTEGRSALYIRLIGRELADPTHATAGVIDQGMRPQIEALTALVQESLGADTPEALVRRCTASILGQCLYYHFARPVIEPLHLEEDLGPDHIASLADHITQFSLVALRHLAQGDSAAREQTG